MNAALLVLATNLPAAAALAGAAYVAANGNDGWGWLIFAGILLAATPEVST